MKLTEILLVEKAKHPNFIGSIKHELVQLKPKLWSKDLDLENVLEILKTVFRKYMIKLVESYDDRDSEYSSVGLNGGALTSSGWIEIGYTSYLKEVLNDETREQYEDFVRLICALIAHELTHREQVDKSLKNFEDIPDTTDIKKYLSDHRELEAYAAQASIELLGSFTIEEVISKLKTDRGLDELSMYSEGLKWYTHTFSSGPILKKFLKKIIEILNDE